MRRKKPESPSTVIRATFGTATVFCFVAAMFLSDDPRWWAAMAACGTIWWAWDILIEHVIEPTGDWILGILTGQESVGEKSALRPTLNDNIRLLESHLEQNASRQVCINAAIRLEEIYRTVKKDPERAKKAIARARELYPDAIELEGYSDVAGGDEEREGRE